MDKNRPLGITLIGYVGILNAIITILMPFTIVMDLFQLQGAPESVIKILVSITTFIIAYGYLRLKKWGYRLMIAYYMLFLAQNILGYQQYQQQLFFVSTIFSVMLLLYVFMKKECFYN